ncbi:hypothetical protein I307_06074 [Cryptococcus deuterogattii 99/473]|uniref:Uncharacterized protein n=1 Tax=Cryptococcus deuterogattii Ram5 TaxID=1296110 RepID=A0A0D0TQJ4_9TREE|nr:hypothetical protein I352_05806 [Cryptococcus deuterogattii MMRL2647]KIR37688.1 hypothetical protein I313_06412 [Cryptococcus deuterogattii Ram5]KIR70299.1 hypothetical protein I310_05926 [Cryptococcus deuterogattii CA1014]KIR96615.1 hypothetical protein L804_06100 [Cryptococcus deuterogattii 2001/935-1]KIY54599.1 hypothetical protein I307_06074 [Cryptococcus deuterogattii 99/473]
MNHWPQSYTPSQTPRSLSASSRASSSVLKRVSY